MRPFSEAEFTLAEAAARVLESAPIDVHADLPLTPHTIVLVAIAYLETRERQRVLYSIALQDNVLMESLRKAGLAYAPVDPRVQNRRRPKCFECNDTGETTDGFSIETCACQFPPPPQEPEPAP
jgi:hypothetical protein